MVQALPSSNTHHNHLHQQHFSGDSINTSLDLGGEMGGGAIMVSASYDHTIRFWDIKTGQHTRTLQHSDSQVNSLAVTPDRKMVAAAGFQHIRMYDLNARETAPLVDYEGVSKNVTGVGFEPSGRWMYTSGEDCTARIWDLRARNPTLTCSKIFQVSYPVNTVCLHPNGTEIIVGDQGGTIHLWDLRNDHNEQMMPVPGVSIQHIDVDTTGTALAAVSNKGHVFLWSMVSGEALTQVADGVATPLASDQLPSPVGTGSGPVSAGVGKGGGPQPMAGSLEGTGVQGPPTSDGSPGGIAKRIVPKLCFVAHPRYALKCRFSPDSTMIATTSGDCTAAVWKTSDMSKLSTLKTDTQRWVWDCAWTSDSRYLFTGSSDNEVRLWWVHEDEGRLERTFSGHQKAVTSLALNDRLVVD